MTLINAESLFFLYPGKFLFFLKLMSLQIPPQLACDQHVWKKKLWNSSAVVLQLPYLCPVRPVKMKVARQLKQPFSSFSLPVATKSSLLLVRYPLVKLLSIPLKIFSMFVWVHFPRMSLPALHFVSKKITDAAWLK